MCIPAARAAVSRFITASAVILNCLAVVIIAARFGYAFRRSNRIPPGCVVIIPVIAVILRGVIILVGIIVIIITVIAVTIIIISAVIGGIAVSLEHCHVLTSGHLPLVFLILVAARTVVIKIDLIIVRVAVFIFCLHVGMLNYGIASA